MTMNLKVWETFYVILIVSVGKYCVLSQMTITHQGLTSSIPSRARFSAGLIGKEIPVSANGRNFRLLNMRNGRRMLVFVDSNGNRRQVQTLSNSDRGSTSNKNAGSRSANVNTRNSNVKRNRQHLSIKERNMLRNLKNQLNRMLQQGINPGQFKLVRYSSSDLRLMRVQNNSDRRLTNQSVREMLKIIDNKLSIQSQVTNPPSGRVTGKVAPTPGSNGVFRFPVQKQRGGGNVRAIRIQAPSQMSQRGSGTLTSRKEEDGMLKELRTLPRMIMSSDRQQLMKNLKSDERQILRDLENLERPNMGSRRLNNGRRSNFAATQSGVVPEISKDDGNIKINTESRVITKKEKLMSKLKLEEREILNQLHNLEQNRKGRLGKETSSSTFQGNIGLTPMADRHGTEKLKREERLLLRQLQHLRTGTGGKLEGSGTAHHSNKFNTNQPLPIESRDVPNKMETDLEKVILSLQSYLTPEEKGVIVNFLLSMNSGNVFAHDSRVETIIEKLRSYMVAKDYDFLLSLLDSKGYKMGGVQTLAQSSQLNSAPAVVNSHTELNVVPTGTHQISVNNGQTGSGSISHQSLIDSSPISIVNSNANQGAISPEIIQVLNGIFHLLSPTEQAEVRRQLDVLGSGANVQQTQAVHTPPHNVQSTLLSSLQKLLPANQFTQLQQGLGGQTVVAPPAIVPQSHSILPVPHQHLLQNTLPNQVIQHAFHPHANLFQRQLTPFGGTPNMVNPFGLPPDMMQELMFGDTTDPPDPVDPVLNGSKAAGAIEAEDLPPTTPPPPTTTTIATPSPTIAVPRNARNVSNKSPISQQMQSISQTIMQALKASGLPNNVKLELHFPTGNNTANIPKLEILPITKTAQSVISKNQHLATKVSQTHQNEAHQRPRVSGTQLFVSSNIPSADFRSQHVIQNPTRTAPHNDIGSNKPKVETIHKNVNNIPPVSKQQRVVDQTAHTVASAGSPNTGQQRIHTVMNTVVNSHHSPQVRPMLSRNDDMKKSPPLPNMGIKTNIHVPRQNKIQQVIPKTQGIVYIPSGHSHSSVNVKKQDSKGSPQMARSSSVTFNYPRTAQINLTSVGNLPVQSVKTNKLPNSFSFNSGTRDIRLLKQNNGDDEWRMRPDPREVSKAVPLQKLQLGIPKMELNNFQITNDEKGGHVSSSLDLSSLTNHRQNQGSNDGRSHAQANRLSLGPKQNPRRILPGLPNHMRVQPINDGAGSVSSSGVKAFSSGTKTLFRISEKHGQGSTARKFTFRPPVSVTRPINGNTNTKHLRFDQVTSAPILTTNNQQPVQIGVQRDVTSLKQSAPVVGTNYKSPVLSFGTPQIMGQGASIRTFPKKQTNEAQRTSNNVNQQHKTLSNFENFGRPVKSTQSQVFANGQNMKGVAFLNAVSVSNTQTPASPIVKLASPQGGVNTNGNINYPGLSTLGQNNNSNIHISSPETGPLAIAFKQDGPIEPLVNPLAMNSQGNTHDTKPLESIVSTINISIPQITRKLEGPLNPVEVHNIGHAHTTHKTEPPPIIVHYSARTPPPQTHNSVVAADPSLPRRMEPIVLSVSQITHAHPQWITTTPGYNMKVHTSNGEIQKISIVPQHSEAKTNVNINGNFAQPALTNSLPLVVQTPPKAFDPPLHTEVIATSGTTCGPSSKLFRCQGVDVFREIPSIEPWCVGKCLQGKCVDTVCKCGCQPDKPLGINPALIQDMALAFSGNSIHSVQVSKALREMQASLQGAPSAPSFQQQNNGNVQNRPPKETSVQNSNNLTPNSQSASSSTDITSLLASIENLIDAKMRQITSSNAQHQQNWNQRGTANQQSSQQGTSNRGGEEVEAEDIKKENGNGAEKSNSETTQNNQNNKWQENNNNNWQQNNNLNNQNSNTRNNGPNNNWQGNHGNGGNSGNSNWQGNTNNNNNNWQNNGGRNDWQNENRNNNWQNNNGNKDNNWQNNNGNNNWQNNNGNNNNWQNNNENRGNNWQNNNGNNNWQNNNGNNWQNNNGNNNWQNGPRDNWNNNGWGNSGPNNNWNGPPWGGSQNQDRWNNNNGRWNDHNRNMPPPNQWQGGGNQWQNGPPPNGWGRGGRGGWGQRGPSDWNMGFSRRNSWNRGSGHSEGGEGREAID